MLPNLEVSIQEYVANPAPSAAVKFMIVTNLGQQSRKRGVCSRIQEAWSNSPAHLWMWDFKAMKVELEQAGFRDIRPIQFGDSPYPPFAEVEHPERFQWNALAFECTK